MLCVIFIQVIKILAYPDSRYGPDTKFCELQLLPKLHLELESGWQSVVMGESFQDYSWIQDFEADFPKKVILKMLKSTDYNSFTDLFLSVL